MATDKWVHGQMGTLIVDKSQFQSVDNVLLD